VLLWDSPSQGTRWKTAFGSANAHRFFTILLFCPQSFGARRCAVTDGPGPSHSVIHQILYSFFYFYTNK